MEQNPHCRNDEDKKVKEYRSLFQSLAGLGKMSGVGEEVEPTVKEEMVGWWDV